MDRLSQLPDFILHGILSFLITSDSSPAELVRMSVLSKTWFHITASFPILYLKIEKFKSRDSFFKYVEYAMSRFSHQNVPAYKVRLNVTLKDPIELDIVNRCLDLLFNKGVRMLTIEITKPTPKYRLPNTLLSVSVLKYLTIRGCELPPSLMVDAVKFKSLIQLTLENVPVDEEAIKYLAASCPLLQVLEVYTCQGLERFSVYHKNLKSVTIYCNSPFEKIDIEAPKLSRLLLTYLDGRGTPRMNLASCKRLTTVIYMGRPVPNLNGFTNFLSNFPFIKKLIMDTRYKYNNLKLSSHSLKTLVLISKFGDLEKIEFSTPNLDLFIYSCDPWYYRSMVRHLPHLKACMRCYSNGSMDTVWFHKLRRFLNKKNGFKALNLYIHKKQEFVELERLAVVELPPYELEHIELHFEHEESSSHAAFVDAVLWCCRPRSLTLRSSFSLTDFEEQSDLVKFTYKKLLEQEDQGHTNIQIVSPSSSKAQKQFSGLMPLLGLSPCEERAISFIKEEKLSKDNGACNGVQMELG